MNTSKKKKKKGNYKMYCIADILMFFSCSAGCDVTCADSWRVGRVCEESHRTLQGWSGSTEPDGLHPERGALDIVSSAAAACISGYRHPFITACTVLNIWPVNQESAASGDHRSAVCLVFAPLPSRRGTSTWETTFSLLFTEGLLVWYSFSVCTPWHTYETWVSPMGEAQTGRMYCTERSF